MERDEQHFVDQYRAELIQQITMVHPVLDRLLQEGLLTQEHYDIVKAKETTQEKMRFLYLFSRGWSFPDKDTFYTALKANNPGVMENLEGTSSGKSRIADDDPIRDLRIQYMASMKERYQRIKEHNSRVGETVSLDKRYTQLLMIKNYQNQQQREFGVTYVSSRHLQKTDDSSSAEDSPTTVQALFHPDEDGFTPKIVVLQGPAGIGKTTTSQKIMLDWASGNLFQDKFGFVFCLSCRELNNVTRNISLAGLLSRMCKLHCPKELMRLVLSNSRKLLFVIDGLDELRWSLKKRSEVCEDPFQETDLKDILRSLLNKHVLCEASVVITTRPFVVKELEEFLEESRHVEILGFTEEEREKYVHHFFEDKAVAEKVFRIIKDNDVIFTMCSIPITCWIVCTVMKQEIKKDDLDLSWCRTTTSVYVLYLKGLIKYHGREQQVLTCLRKVCALANEGVFSKRILFEESDLRRHGLSMTEMESVFLNESIFHKDIGVSTSYSFIHLTVQEFFAALWYVLEETLETDHEASRARRVLSSPNWFFGGSAYLEFSVQTHLSLLVQFLCGLSNTNQVKELSEMMRCDITFQLTPEMRRWLVPPFECLDEDLICCLYEMQDEKIVRKAMSLMEEDFKVELKGGMRWARQLAYCLKNCKTFQRMKFGCHKMSTEDLEILSPFLQKCSLIEFVCSDSISNDGLHSLMLTSKSLKKLVLFQPCLKYFEVCIISDVLRRPGCSVEMVRFCCHLTNLICDDLCSLIGIQPKTKMDVTFYMAYDMSVSEAKRMFERLRLLGCTLHTCSLWCQRLNKLIGYKITYDSGREEIWICTDEEE